METQLSNWFDAILKHAQKNYNVGGWDMFVECVDVNEFVDEYNAKQFDSYDSALAFYKNDLHIRAPTPRTIPPNPAKPLAKIVAKKI